MSSTPNFLARTPSARANAGSMRSALLWALTLPLYFLDQSTKWLVLHSSGGDTDWSIPVLHPWLTWVYWQNTGAAFSIGDGNNGFFIALSVVALAALVFAARKGVFANRLSRVATAVLAAGILGNLTDRIAHGHVVDFVLVDLAVWPADPWPAFNVADSCICIAATLLVLASWKSPATAPDR